MAEVAIALAIVAFGLVAVLGILPMGVTVTRDNKEDTLIKNDAEYWMNAIRGGPLALEALNHVEWVELDVNGQMFRAEYAPLMYDPWPDDPSIWPRFDTADELPPVEYRGTMKQANWRTDVIGWLSTPDVPPGGGGVVVKFAKIRPFGNTILDRQFGRKGVNTDGEVVYQNEGGDMTFSYLLQSNIREVGPNFWEIKLTLKWPIIEEGATAATVKTGPGQRKFVAYINAPIEKGFSRWDLGTLERTIYDSLLPDEPLTESQVVKFHTDQGLGEGQVRQTLKALADIGLVRKPSRNTLIPGPLYESFGAFSMRRIDDPTPPLYAARADGNGNFDRFTKPLEHYGQFYFFKPALDD